MKKRVLSILLCLCMVLALFPVTALAEEGKTVSFTVTADKTEAQPGDTITFTLTMGPVKEFSFADLEFIIPDGLSFGEVTLADGLETTLNGQDVRYLDHYGPGSGKPGFLFLHGCNYTSTADTALMTFQCTVNNDAAPGAKTVGAGLYDDDETNCFDVDGDLIAATFTPATVTVPEPTLAITVGGFYVGNTPADCTVTIESTNLGATFGEDDIDEIMWSKIIVDGNDSTSCTIARNESFEDGVIYIFQINLKNYNLEQVPDATVNGKKAAMCSINPATGILEISQYFGTPAPAITINGADKICAQQDYEFTATPADGVTLDETFGFGNGSSGNGVGLTIDEDGVGHGVLPAEFYSDKDSFVLTVYGKSASGKPETSTKTVQVSQDHIFDENGVCDCGAVKTYTITYVGGEGVEGSIPSGVKTHSKDFTLSSGTFTRKGCVQTGWVDQNGNEYELGGACTLNEDMTLYPVWDGTPPRTVS